MQTFPQTRWTWIPFSIGVFLFVAIYFTGSNQSLFIALNHMGHPLGDDFWNYLTLLGDGAVALAFVLPTIRRFPQTFWGALIAAVFVGIAVQACKQIVPYPRPLSVLPAAAFFHSGPMLRAVSFPSGHAATIFVLTGTWIMSLAGHQMLRMLLLVLAIAVGLSRIMVGVHWPLDVLAGMLIGWSGAYIGIRLAARLGWRTRTIGGCLAGVILMATAGWLLFSTHTGYPAVLWLQRLVGLVCLSAGAGEVYLMLTRGGGTAIGQAPGQSPDGSLGGLQTLGFGTGADSTHSTHSETRHGGAG